MKVLKCPQDLRRSDFTYNKGNCIHYHYHMLCYKSIKKQCGTGIWFWRKILNIWKTKTAPPLFFSWIKMKWCLLKCHLLSIFRHAAAAAKLLQSCPTLCDPIDGSPPGSPVSGILQARTLEWVAISFSNAWKWSHLVMSNPQRPHGLQPSRLLRTWDFPGKSTGVGCHCLLQRLDLFKVIFNYPQ